MIDWKKTVAELKRSSNMTNQLLTIAVSKQVGRQLAESTIAKIANGETAEPFYSTGAAIITLCSRHNVNITIKP